MALPKPELKFLKLLVADTVLCVSVSSPLCNRGAWSSREGRWFFLINIYKCSENV